MKSFLFAGGGGVPRVFLFALSCLCLLCSARARALDMGEVRAVFFASRKATLSSEISLPIQRIHKQMGESFSVGDVLLEFDRQAADANVEVGKAALAAASASLEAVASMYARKNASKVELEAAKRENATAEMKLLLARRELAACVVAAPFSGRIEEILVNEHELVGRGDKLLILVDDRVLRARFLVSEEDFRRIGIGNRVSLRLMATGEMVDGVIANIAAVFDSASGTIEVWADVDNSAGKMRAGMSATVVRINE